MTDAFSLPIAIMQLSVQATFYGLFPLAFILLTVAVWRRKTDPELLPYAKMICGLVLFWGALFFLTWRFFTWVFAVGAKLTAAIEKGTSVPTDEILSPWMQAWGSIWWVFALLTVAMLFIPASSSNR